MSRKAWLVLIAAGVATASVTAARGEKAQEAEQSRGQTQSSFFLPQLLTEEEQATYRARIRRAQTPQEIEAVRAEHYELMKVRAKEKGVILPETRPAAGVAAGFIFNPQLTTEDERAAYRAKLRSAKTREALDRIRFERREEVEARAKEMGVVVPKAEPAPRGGSAGILGSIFGPKLITEEEQAAYRARLRRASTPEEREKLRAEHHRQLQESARRLGVVLSQ